MTEEAALRLMNDLLDGKPGAPKKLITALTAAPEKPGKPIPTFSQQALLLAAAILEAHETDVAIDDSAAAYSLTCEIRAIGARLRLRKQMFPATATRVDVRKVCEHYAERNGTGLDWADMACSLRAAGVEVVE